MRIKTRTETRRIQHNEKGYSLPSDAIKISRRFKTLYRQPKGRRNSGDQQIARQDIPVVCQPSVGRQEAIRISPPMHCAKRRFEWMERISLVLPRGRARERKKRQKERESNKAAGATGFLSGKLLSATSSLSSSSSSSSSRSRLITTSSSFSSSSSSSSFFSQ